MAFKNLDIKIKAGPDDGLSEGEFDAYASVFGNVDSYGDKVMKGAFAGTLADWKASGNPIPLLFGHNMSDPDFNIGSVEGIEDDHGLRVKGELDLENPKAVQVYRLLKGRRLTQMSFAYDVLDSTETKVGDERVTELNQLKLYEVSLVPVGANQETEILAVKTLAGALMEGKKAGRTISAKNESDLKDARDLIDRVLGQIDAEEAKSGSASIDSALKTFSDFLAQMAGMKTIEGGSVTAAAKPEEPDQAKGEEPPGIASLNSWAAKIRYEKERGN